MKRAGILFVLFCFVLSGCALIEDIMGGDNLENLTPFTVEERDPVSLPEPKMVDPDEAGPVDGSDSGSTNAAVDPDALLSELMFHVDLINSCYAETCGAQMDDSTLYRRVYASEEAFMNGEAPIDVVTDSEMVYADRHDLSDAGLYEITNFKTNAEAFDYLTNYMTDELAESLFPNEFLEMDGKLYMVYDSRGYGAYQLDPATAVLTDVSDTYCTMKIDGLLFDERTPCQIDFMKDGDGWKAYSIVDTDC